MKSSRYLLFSLFALFVIFSDELFYSFISFWGITLHSGMKAQEAVFIAIVSYSLLIYDLITGKLTRNNWFQFLSLLIILGLYYLTSIIYTSPSSNYWSQLLAFGALSIPSCYIGMRLSREDCEESVINLLPLFVIVVSLIIGRAILTKSISGELLGRDGENIGFNYQNASYYMAFCYSYCLSYVLFLGRTGSKSFFSRLLYIVMLGLLFFCSICCISGGGRGAFVFMIAITVYLSFRSLQHVSFVTRLWTSILIILSAVVLLFLANSYGVFGSEGFLIVSENLTFDPVRNELRHRAISAFQESPIIGNGLGSIWWKLGFYSHNIVTDLLVESGIIGTFIIGLIMIRCLIRIARDSRKNRISLFLFIVFLGAITEVTFSGYWLSASKLFLIYGYVYATTRPLLHIKYK